MMRRRLLLAAALCAAAAPPPPPPPPQPQQQIGPTALHPGEVLRGRFVQERHLSGFANVPRTEGRFVLAPGHGLIWQADTPFAVRTVITPAGLTQRIGTDEVLRLSARRIPFLARLSDMLTGTLARDWSALEQDFVLARSGDAASWQVVLTPRRAPDPATMPFARIVVAGGGLVDSVEMVRPGGDTDMVRFHDQRVGPAPLDAGEQRALDGNG
jgi:hypothetical protein